MNALHPSKGNRVEDGRLKQYEDRYRRQFETAPDGIVIIDYETGKVLAANPRFVDWLSYSREVLLGRLFWSIEAWGERDQAMAVRRELQSQGHVHHHDVTLRSKSGEVYHARVSWGALTRRESAKSSN